MFSRVDFTHVQVTCSGYPSVATGNMSLLLERRLVFFLEQIHLLSYIVFFRANPGHVKPPRLAMRPLLFLPDGPMAGGRGADLLHPGFQENPSRQTNQICQTCCSPYG